MADMASSFLFERRTLMLWWRQFWEDVFDRSNLRFGQYIYEYMELEDNNRDRRKAKRILRKQRVELTIQSICLLFI